MCEGPEMPVYLSPQFTVKSRHMVFKIPVVSNVLASKIINGKGVCAYIYVMFVVKNGACAIGQVSVSSPTLNHGSWKGTIFNYERGTCAVYTKMYSTSECCEYLEYQRKIFLDYICITEDPVVQKITVPKDIIV